MAELLLDACVVINLIGSGVPLAELAGANQSQFLMARLAAQEVLFLGSESEEGALEPIVLERLEQGSLGLVDFDDDERLAFIELARHLDDGEAATLAIAHRRRWPVATDDRKAQRLAESLEPPILLVSTSALLREWAMTTDSSRQIADALRNVERRASYSPRRNDPDRAWWTGAMQLFDS